MDKSGMKNMTIKTETKTYEAKGMVELTLHLLAGHKGQPDITVTFEGGKITGYGVTPATFTTSDPIIQKFIEDSGYFKRNIIKLKGKDK